MYKVDPSSSWAQIQIPVSSFFHLDVQVPSAVAPQQLLVQVIAHAHTRHTFMRVCTYTQ